ncbi:MAG TPA: hypothetical protein VIZ67_08245 [Acidimicrobiales bacterium]
MTPATADHVPVTGATLPSPGTRIVEGAPLPGVLALVFSFEVPIR